jgi:hypothetical protein
MLLGLGAIALAALLTVNVGIATSNESTNALLTLKGLEAMAGDDVEGGGGGRMYQTMGYCGGWKMTWCCTSRQLAYRCTMSSCDC